MEDINGIIQKLDRKARGNIGLLDSIYRVAMKQIRKSCGSEADFAKRRDQLLDNVCAAVGEEYRGFYAEYIREMETARNQE